MVKHSSKILASKEKATTIFFYSSIALKLTSQLDRSLIGPAILLSPYPESTTVILWE